MSTCPFLLEKFLALDVWLILFHLILCSLFLEVNQDNTKTFDTHDWRIWDSLFFEKTMNAT